MANDSSLTIYIIGVIVFIIIGIICGIASIPMGIVSAIRKSTEGFLTPKNCTVTRPLLNCEYVLEDKQQYKEYCSAQVLINDENDNLDFRLIYEKFDKNSIYGSYNVSQYVTCYVYDKEPTFAMYFKFTGTKFNLSLQWAAVGMGVAGIAFIIGSVCWPCAICLLQVWGNS
ncbi:hypothetical protein ABK040_000702 [Willaertia magna]